MFLVSHQSCVSHVSAKGVTQGLVLGSQTSEDAVGFLPSLNVHFWTDLHGWRLVFIRAGMINTESKPESIV